MVDQVYVQKRRRKKIAAIVGAACSGVAIVMMLIAFLGYHVGAFTVKLRQNDVKLMLTQDSESAMDGKTEEEGADTTSGTTYLLVSSLPKFELHTDAMLQDHDRYDNANTDYLDGALINPKNDEVVSLYYFKYTFFLKNIGQYTADYRFNLRISENQQPTNVHGYGYDDIMRVRLYQNIGNSHNYKTYAKPPRSGTEGHIDEEGNIKYEEKISNTSPYYATNFTDSSNIANVDMDNFHKGQYIRYTILVWLEGSDPQCKNTAPEGGSIKLEISITANKSQIKNEN